MYSIGYLCIIDGIFGEVTSDVGTILLPMAIAGYPPPPLLRSNPSEIHCMTALDPRLNPLRTMCCLDFQTYVYLVKGRKQQV